MTRNPPSAKPPRRLWRERVIVLGPFAGTVLAAASGMAEHILAPLSLAAIAWTVLASLVLALRSRARRGDGSPFTNYQSEPDREDEEDFDSRTGAYHWMRERDERFLWDDPDRFH